MLLQLSVLNEDNSLIRSSCNQSNGKWLEFNLPLEPLSILEHSLTKWIVSILLSEKPPFCKYVWGTFEISYGTWKLAFQQEKSEIVLRQAGVGLLLLNPIVIKFKQDKSTKMLRGSVLVKNVSFEQEISPEIYLRGESMHKVVCYAVMGKRHENGIYLGRPQEILTIGNTRWLTWKSGKVKSSFGGSFGVKNESHWGILIEQHNDLRRLKQSPADYLLSPREHKTEIVPDNDAFENPICVLPLTKKEGGELILKFFNIHVREEKHLYGPCEVSVESLTCKHLLTPELSVELEGKEDELTRITLVAKNYRESLFFLGLVPMTI